ncbi:MAG: low molecular weight phosphotyrosine protein phosphatase [Muribaculaceae bacterium]|nr:low molecular weight phosphotyrosine protein phosphatase [Muribaculaceae bacterium]
MSFDNDNRSRITAALRDKDIVRVLFVCLGNICRSPAAQGVMQAVVDEHGDTARWEIDSAGTGDYHTGDLPDRRMRVHAQRRGYNLTHRARQVRESDFDRFDLIVPMDASNERNLRRLAPTPSDEAKIVPMAAWISMTTRHDHVPDPYYEGAEGFELVLDLLQDACANLYDDIRK